MFGKVSGYLVLVAVIVFIAVEGASVFDTLDRATPYVAAGIVKGQEFLDTKVFASEQRPLGVVLVEGKWFTFGDEPWEILQKINNSQKGSLVPPGAEATINLSSLGMQLTVINNTLEEKYSTSCKILEYRLTGDSAKEVYWFGRVRYNSTEDTVESLIKSKDGVVDTVGGLVTVDLIYSGNRLTTLVVREIVTDI